MLRTEGYWFMQLGLGDRARRQHRPPARRQILSAAAARARRSAARSTATSGRRSSRSSRPRPPIATSIRGPLQALAGRRLPDLPRRDAALARRLGRGDGRPALRLRRPLAAARARPTGSPASGSTGSQALDIDTVFQDGLHEWLHAYIARQCGARPGDRAAVQVRLMQLTVHYTTTYHLCRSRRGG